MRSEETKVVIHRKKRKIAQVCEKFKKFLEKKQISCVVEEKVLLLFFSYNIVNFFYPIYENVTLTDLVLF
jgi:hypothetical protein